MKSGKIAVILFSLFIASSSFAEAQAEEKTFPPSDQVAGDVKKIEADRADNPTPAESPYRPEHNYTHGR